MTTFIALLRSVNLGQVNRVPMAGFRTLLVALGYADVTTLLNSGNAVFRAHSRVANTHATAIAAAIARKLKVEVPVIVKSAGELAAIVAKNPFAVDAAEHPRFLVAFTQQPKALSGLAAIEPLVQPPEGFAIGRHAAYLHCAHGILESKAGAALLGKAGRAVTTRNLATTLKLLALAERTG